MLEIPVTAPLANLFHQVDVQYHHYLLQFADQMVNACQLKFAVMVVFAKFLLNAIVMSIKLLDNVVVAVALQHITAIIIQFRDKEIVLKILKTVILATIRLINVVVIVICYKGVLMDLVILI